MAAVVLGGGRRGEWSVVDMANEQAPKLLMIADGRIVASRPGPDGKPERVVFQPGDEVDPSLFTDGEVRRMRRQGFLRFPSEVRAPEQVSADLAELAALRAQLAELKAAQEQGAGGGRTAEFADQTAAALAALNAGPVVEAGESAGGKGGKAK